VIVRGAAVGSFLSRAFSLSMGTGKEGPGTATAGAFGAHVANNDGVGSHLAPSADEARKASATRCRAAGALAGKGVGGDGWVRTW